MTKKDKKPKKMKRKAYEQELAKLEIELVKLQGWIKQKGLKVAVIFEGRDSAGKGGTIKRITYRLSPRVARVVALPTPTEKEKTQWYFQRYIPHLPSAGEMVLFDRSWYNRAGVERVMGFCTDEQYTEFMSTVNGFELALVRSGMTLKACPPNKIPIAPMWAVRNAIFSHRIILRSRLSRTCVWHKSGQFAQRLPELGRTQYLQECQHGLAFHSVRKRQEIIFLVPQRNKPQVVCHCHSLDAESPIGAPCGHGGGDGVMGAGFCFVSGNTRCELRYSDAPAVCDLFEQEV